MSARFGDSFIPLKSGEVLPLRLSFGALSEIAQRMDSSGPMALARRLHPLTDFDTKTIAAAMYFAATGRRDFKIDEADLPALSTAIAAQIEAAFGGAFL